MASEACENHTVVSADGTEISVTVTGTGRPVVIEPGSLSTAAHWQAVANALAAEARVFTIDRRGRGRSGGHIDHSMQREFDDLAAVRELAGPDAILVGHSYGAVITLGQALLDPPRAIVVYEPPIALEGSIASGLEPFGHAVESGELDTALAVGMAHFVRMPSDVIEVMRQTPIWEMLLPLTPTWGPEMWALNAFDSGVEQFSELRVPVLELVGELSPPWLVEASERLAGVLPSARVERIRDQGHEAYAADPVGLARHLQSFILDH